MEFLGCLFQLRTGKRQGSISDGLLDLLTVGRLNDVGSSGNVPPDAGAAIRRPGAKARRLPTTATGFQALRPVLYSCLTCGEQIEALTGKVCVQRQNIG